MMVLLKFIIVVLITFLLCLPFLPFKKVCVCFACFDYDKRERHKNLPFVISTLLVSLILLLTLPYINHFFNWLVSLRFFIWLQDKLPKRLEYTVVVFKYIILNLTTAILFLIIKSTIKAWLDKKYNYENSSKSKKKASNKRKEIDKKSDKNNVKVERDRTLERLRRDSEFLFEVELDEREEEKKKNNITVENRKNINNETKINKNKLGIPNKNNKEETKFEFDTFSDFFIFVYNKFKGIFYDSESGFEIEHYPAVKWGTELGIFLFIIGVLYLIIAFGILLPIFFDFRVNFLYQLILKLVTNIYLYPMIGFVILREIHAFLSGVPKSDDIPENGVYSFVLNRKKKNNLEFVKLKQSLIDNNKDYYINTLRVSTKECSTYDLTNAPNAIKKLDEIIRQSNQTSNKDYLFGFEMMLKGENVLFDVSLYSSLGIYILYYLNAVMVLGRRVLIICPNEAKLSEVRDYLRNGLEKITHFAMPVWRIEDFDGIRTGEMADMLLLVPENFNDEELFTSGSYFFDELSDVFVLDTEKLMMANNYQCLVISKRLAGAVAKDSRRRLRYTFMTEGNTFNLDHSIQQLFNLENNGLVSINSFGAQTATDVFLWSPGQEHTVHIDHASYQNPLERRIAEISYGFGIKNIVIESETADRCESIGNLRGIEFNKCNISSNDIGYIIVDDNKFNLAETFYRYLRYSGKKKTILHIIEKPYLLREYFLQNINRYTNHYDVLGKFSYEHANENVAKLIILLADAVSESGISRDEFIERAMAMQEFIGVQNTSIEQGQELDIYVNACLKKAFGEKYNEDVLKYRVEYANVKNKGFDYILHITNVDNLFESFLKASSAIRLEFDNSDTVQYMPIPRTMLYQNFIESQIISFDKKYYTIKKIDPETGSMTLDNTDVTINFPDDYIQTRNYAIGKSIVKQTSNIQFIMENAAISSMDISLYNASVDVETTGYFEVSGTLKTVNFKDPGSKYHELTDDKKNAIARHIDTNLLRVIMHTEKESSDCLSISFSIIIQEMMKTMFPDVYKCIAVCPVISSLDRKSISKTDQFNNMLRLYPELTSSSWNDAQESADKLEFVIIEDVSGGNGVVRNFIEAEGNALVNIIGFAANFLAWACEDTQNRLEYLRFGYESLPDEFDVVELCELLGQFRTKVEYNDYNFDEESVRCSICHNKVDEDEIVYVKSGRGVCRQCRSTTVNTYDKLEDCLKRTYESVKQSTSVAETLPNVTVDFVSTKELRKQVNENDAFPIGYCDYSRGSIFVEYGLSESAVCGLIARLITDLWQNKTSVFDGTDICLGQYDYVEILVAEKLSFSDYLNAIQELYAINFGYTELCDRLKSAGTTDSFAFLLERAQGLTKRKNNGIGVGFTIKSRDPSNVPMFYYNCLSNSEKQSYDLILKGIYEFREEIGGIEGIEGVEQLDKIMTALKLDHSEIFWLEHQSYRYLFDSKTNSVTVIPNYCMDRNMAEKRQKKIDKVTEKFLLDITPSTGDYEAALHIHERLVKIIDYDSIMLEEQKKLNKRHIKYIDDLRSIYGTLVKHKAVCAGYARAYAYLLNKIGIECAYVKGDCTNRGPHAWNLLKLEDEYYYTDVTWDDHSNTNPSKHSDYTTFSYFCITTEELLRSRSISYCNLFDIPECAAINCNYFVRENYYFETLNFYEIKEAILDQYRRGLKVIGLKFANKNLCERTKKYLLSEGGLDDVFYDTGEKTSKMLCFDNSDVNVLIIRL